MTKNAFFFAFAALLGLAGAVGCSSNGEPSFDDNSLNSQDGDPASDGDPALECTNKPKSHAWVGFGKTDLLADRPNEASGLNRARVKPFSVMQGEYARTIGAAPSSLASRASTFGEQKPRWYEEDRSGALELDASFGVAFQGCLDFTKSAAEYGATPTEDTAKKNCTTMMRKFWSADAAEEEVAACAGYAVTGTVKETNPRRRWAYVCASVLSSSKFLTF